MAGEKIVEQIEHRFKLIETLNQELESRQVKVSSNLLLNKEKIGIEISNMRNDLKGLSSEIDVLVKSIYGLGNTLKDNLRKTSLTEMKEKIDAWPLEEFILKKELEGSFKKYN